MDDIAATDFSSTVREKINEIDLNQRTIADIAKVSNKTISKIVNERDKPSNKGQVVRICVSLSLNPEQWLENLGFQYTEADIAQHSTVVAGNIEGVHQAAFTRFGLELLTGNELTDEWGRISDSTSYLYQQAEDSLNDIQRVVIQFGLQLEIVQDTFLEAMVNLLKRNYRILWYFDRKRDYSSAVKQVERSVSIRAKKQLVEQCRFGQMAEHESAHYLHSFTIFNPLSLTGPALVYPNVYTHQYGSTNRVLAYRFSDRSNFGMELSKHGIDLLKRNLNPDLEISDPVWKKVKDTLVASMEV